MQSKRVIPKKQTKKNEFRALRPPPGIRPWRGRPDLRDRRKSTCVINRKWPEGLLRCLRGSAIAICIQKSCRCGDQPHPTASLDTKKRTLLRISPTAPERPIAEVEGFYLCPLDPWHSNPKTRKHAVIVNLRWCVLIYWCLLTRFHSCFSDH